MWWICFIFHTDKLPGQCAVLQRNKRFIYYLVNIKHVSNRVFISPSPFVTKLVHFRRSSRGCVAGHKEKGEPQAELRQPETEPGGHEVAVRTGRSDESVDAAVRALPPRPVDAAVPLPASRPQPCALLFPCLSRSIGCGLDRLKWDQVSEILERVFGRSGISITVYSLPERAETKVMNENRRR